jgi:hypothetical protein
MYQVAVASSSPVSRLQVATIVGFDQQPQPPEKQLMLCHFASKKNSFSPAGKKHYLMPNRWLA